MELIGKPACACTHNLPTQTPKFFLLIIHARFRPQALANFQLDRKLQGRAFLVPNDV